MNAMMLTEKVVQFMDFFSDEKSEQKQNWVNN